MANTKISALGALGAAPASNDLIPIVDVSDTSQGAGGTTKTITVANLGGMSLVGTASVAGAAATTLAISGLDLDADGRYFIEYSLKNATGSAAEIRLFFNSDTTTTNYDSQVGLINGATFSGGRNNSARFIDLSASLAAQGHGYISKDFDGRPRSEIMGSYESTTTFKLWWAATMWRTAGTNVTGITLSSTVASALAIGSVIRVWKIT